MLKLSEIVVIVHRAMNEPTLFCRKDGSFTSVLTSDCIFNRQEAWHFVNCRPCDSSKFETYCFKTISEGISYLGLTPSEMAEKKRLLIAEYTKTHKSEKKEFLQNAKKKKRASAENEKSAGLFKTVGGDRNTTNASERSGSNPPFDIF